MHVPYISKYWRNTKESKNDQEIKVVFNTKSRYLNLNNLIEDKTKLLLNGRLDKSMMDESYGKLLVTEQSLL